MSTAPVTTPGLLTAEEFAWRPDPGYPEELVRSRILPLPFPKPRHGEICIADRGVLDVRRLRYFGENLPS